jgi:hypothetical protein
VLGARFVQAGQVHRGGAGSSTLGSRLPSAGSGDAVLAPSRPTGWRCGYSSAVDQVPMPASTVSGVTNRWRRCCVGGGGSTLRDGPVWPEGAWSADLSAQDRDLVAQDEDLGVLGCLRSGQQSEPAEELAEDQVEESERHCCIWRSLKPASSARGLERHQDAQA